MEKKVNELSPHPANAEFFPGKPENWQFILNDIRERGIQNPIVLANDGKTILAGHLRWEAAKELGMGEVPVEIREDISPDSKGAGECACLKLRKNGKNLSPNCRMKKLDRRKTRRFFILENQRGRWWSM